MSNTQKLSLSAAVFINVNIMLGAGIFINTVVLAQQVGTLGGFNYLIVGLLMLPLIISMAELVKMHPSGGFYTFAQKEINPLSGFISAWSYFIGKLASATVMIHTSVLLAQELIPSLTSINPFIIDIMILASFIFLNMFSLKTGGNIQAIFISIKIVPILFVILSGIFLIHGNHFTHHKALWSGIPSSMPLVFYTIMGFEAACSLSDKIKNPRKNAPRAIFISFAFVIMIAFLYQLIFYGAVGELLRNSIDYRAAFPALVSKLLPNSPTFVHTTVNILHIALASSAIGGAYSIIFSNSWNLYSLAQNSHVLFSKSFIKLNRQHIPFACIIIEGLVCALYLIITRGNQIYLQQLGALGVIIAYTLSVISLLYAKKNKPLLPISYWIPILGLFSCLLLMSTCIGNFLKEGIMALYAFVAILSIGILMFVKTKKKQDTLKQP